MDAVDIPVIADMDAGHGNALNVTRSVREYEKTRVPAFHLEDQVSPKAAVDLQAAIGVYPSQTYRAAIAAAAGASGRRNT